MVVVHGLTRAGADGAVREAAAGSWLWRTNRTSGARPRPHLFRSAAAQRQSLGITRSSIPETEDGAYEQAQEQS